MFQYKTSDFDYKLPEELVASNPLAARDRSRLLIAQNHNQQDVMLDDKYFDDLLEFITIGDLIVFNDSKVIKARIFGNKDSGGRIELLVERIVDDNIISHIRSNKTISIGLLINLPGELVLEVTQKLDGLFNLKINSVKNKNFNWYDYLEEFGHIPLPPYMKREAISSDDKNYQTVYAKNPGSVAAPTAGLHFTEDLLHRIKDKGIDIAYVTLHVGSGTFKPVSVENIAEHKMHSEVYNVAQNIIEKIRLTKQNGNKVIAVGTTSLRVLESIARDNFSKLSGETDIFITPGFEFKVVDKLITNFHLPKSTLLMLVSAFAGFEQIKAVYNHAITNKYRFYSYGDAMLLERKM